MRFWFSNLRSLRAFGKVYGNNMSDRGLKPFNQLQPPNVTPADLGNAEQALDLERDAGLN